MPILTGLAFALFILFLVLLMTHAARDLQSSPTFYRLRRRAASLIVGTTRNASSDGAGFRFRSADGRDAISSP